VPIKDKTLTMLDISGKNLGMEGAVVVAEYLRDNGALSKLVMRQNDIHGAEAGRVFSDMLVRNTVLKELDLSSQKVGNWGKPMDAAFAKEFAAGISGNGALVKLDISNNSIGAAKKRGLQRICVARGIDLTM
jgi:hypothetical protein